MYLMYVDESGDSGHPKTQSPYFALSGLIIHELRWRTSLDQLIDFRREIRRRFGLKLREEIHAPRFISRPGDLVRIKRHDRLTILRHFTDLLASMPDFNVINVLVEKQGKSADCDVFDMAWRALLQRFENTISNHNFTGPRNPDDKGTVFPDHTDDKKLKQLIRRLRHFNPVPNQQAYGRGYRNLKFSNITEDPSFRNSQHSYFIQAVDLCAFLLYQRIHPNRYMQRTGGQAYFNRLDPILCKVAAPRDPDGIVRL